MSKKQTPKKEEVKAPVVETEETVVVDEVKTEEAVVVEAPKAKVTPKKEDKFNPKSVSQSTRSVSFEWSKGKKSGTKETMSENVAEIMEHKGLGKKVK
jgi:hypothetical protein